MDIHLSQIWVRVEIRKQKGRHYMVKEKSPQKVQKSLHESS